MNNDYRDIINRIFDKEMNRDFDAYRSANAALDESIKYGPSQSMRVNVDDILNDQIIKEHGYPKIPKDEHLIDYHKKMGYGSEFQPKRANIVSLGTYNPQNDIIKVSPVQYNPLTTLDHELAHEADWKYGSVSEIANEHIPMNTYSSGKKFKEFLIETGRIPNEFIEGKYVNVPLHDENFNLLKDNFDIGLNPSVGNPKNIEAGITKIDEYDAGSYRHHLPDNQHVKKTTGIILPKESAMHPIEKRLVLARMIKNMGLRSLPVISTIAESAGNVVGLAEAAQHPLTDPDEIGLRLVNTIAPNEQTEADVEYMKKLREYNSL